MRNRENAPIVQIPLAVFRATLNARVNRTAREQAEIRKGN